MSTEFGISNVDTACVEVLLLDTGEITARVFTGPESLAARRSQLHTPRLATRRPPLMLGGTTMVILPLCVPRGTSDYPDVASRIGRCSGVWIPHMKSAII